MKIIQKVLIKQVITEKSKAKLRTNFHRDKMRLEQECEQLLFEQRKLQNKPGVSQQKVGNRFQQEIKNRKEKMQLLDFKTEQLDMLEIGSEIVEKEVDALVEVEVGMHWNEIMEKKAIVIQNDVVIRIDE